MAFHSLHFGPLSIETNARGDLDLILTTGPLAPQVLAVAYRAIAPDAWNVHCIVKGGVPVPCEGERVVLNRLLAMGAQQMARTSQKGRREDVLSCALA